MKILIPEIFGLLLTQIVYHSLNNDQGSNYDFFSFKFKGFMFVEYLKLVRTVLKIIILSFFQHKKKYELINLQNKYNYVVLDLLHLLFSIGGDILLPL